MDKIKTDDVVSETIAMAAAGSSGSPVFDTSVDAPAGTGAVRRAVAERLWPWAAIGHDLRQPLQAAVLFQHILAQRNRDPALAEPIDRLRQALAAQQEMIESLVEFAKLEAGTVVPRLGPFPVQEVINRVAASFGPRAQAAGIGFRMVPTTLVVHSDARQVERMLAALLSNALRFTEQGRILIGCRRGEGSARLQVGDTGIGIASDDSERIFGSFLQLDPPVGSNLKGLGLGLTILDRLAKLLGHRVRLWSVRGKGSLFEIELPLTPA